VIPFGQVIDVQDSPSGPRYRETIARSRRRRVSTAGG
jgi:hypothetical protein